MKKKSSAPTIDHTHARVLVVDDHPFVRNGIRQLINDQPDMEVVAEAETANEAMLAVEQSLPDVAVVDLALRESSGLEFIKDMQARHPEMKILVLSMHDETFYAERVLRAGGRGYITKEEQPEKLIEGIREVQNGHVYVSDRMREKMLLKMVGQRNTPELVVDRLTDRELQLFEMIGQGLPTRTIAQKLHLSVKTIESHRENIKKKLQLSSATDLLKHAIQWVQSQSGV